MSGSKEKGRGRKACRKCGSAMDSRRENYKYEASGLDNVVLADIEVRSCPACGERVATIPALPELHRALAFALARKPERLAAKEIRYLRKYLGLSRDDFAGKIGVDPTTVSRYESTADPQPMGRSTERLLRLMVLVDQPVERYPLESFANEEPKPQRLTLAPSKKEGWALAAAAA